jgi:diguanylate cyclase (GGDEF)-like protein/PAS domain S-box-containing protein
MSRCQRLTRWKGGAVAERAGRVEFVPLSSSDAGQASWDAPGRPLAAYRSGRLISLSPSPLSPDPLVPVPSLQMPAPQIALPDSPTLVCEGDVVVQANPAAVLLAGRWLPDSLIGLPLRQLLADPGTGTGAGNDAELIGPDGHGVPVRFTRWTVPGTELVVLFLVDVSDLCAVGHPSGADELAAQRARLTEAQRIARVGTWEWDPGCDRLVWSEMMQALYGVAYRQTTYRAFLSLVHPDDRDWVDALWCQLVIDRVPVECEHRVLRPDGTIRTFRCHGAAIADASGSLRLVGTVQDVTEQRAAETRMMRSSQRFADLVAITPVGIGIFDDNDRLVDANEALCKLLGYDLETLRGMSFEAFTHPDERAGRRILRTHHTARSESYTVPQQVLLRADGDLVCCELHVSASVQDDGQRFLLMIFTDITERRRVAETLTYRATHDELTGLPNRAAIKDTLAELLVSESRDIAVLFCGIDNFKRVNDSLGHDAGDELLVALAQWLQDGLPEGCTAGRLSGDVFVVICSDVAALGGVGSLVATVSRLLRTAVPLRGQVVRVSAAIGVAVPDASTRDSQDLLRFADAAMYEAKRTGTGHFAMANAALIESADQQVELECELRDALARDELQLHYQPVVSRNGVILSAEALVRWPHPERGMINPGVFLPVAEQGGLMRELDRWVLRTALREARDWVASNGRPVAVAVNLADPGDPDFVVAVAAAVADSGLPWDRLVLELVETTLIDLPTATRQAMDELAERGVRFAVDDFGTGYSSLARLKELPAQILKLDRQFVTGVGDDPADFAVARAVVDMAHAMGRFCVAEGVETAAQFQALRSLGVDAYQGWLFSRAVPGPDFRALLQRGPLR